MVDYDILVISELNVDLILTGDVTPAFGQAEELVDDATLALGGSSAIFACGASRLGLRVGLLGKVGGDDFGRFVLRTLQSRGVDTSSVIVDPLVKTGLTLHLSRGADRAMLTYPGSIAALRPADVDRALLRRARHVHLGSYYLQTGVQPVLPDLFAAIRAAGSTVSLDPGWDPAERWDGGLLSTLQQVDVFLPNRQEAIAIAGAAGLAPSSASAAPDLPAALEWLAQRVPLAVVKLGADGACVQQGASGLVLPGFRVEAVDTTGAGDSFDAGFLYGFIKGLDLADCVRWGCACGALAATRIGGIEGQPDAARVVEFLRAAT